MISLIFDGFGVSFIVVFNGLAMCKKCLKKALNVWRCQIKIGNLSGTAKKYSDRVIAGAEDRKLFVGGLSWETKEVQLKH